MALRLLRYCCRIWEADRRDHPDEQYLRPVLPLVFYQGEHHWHYAIELAESFPPALRGQPVGAAVLPAAAGPDPDSEVVPENWTGG